MNKLVFGIVALGLTAFAFYAGTKTKQQKQVIVRRSLFEVSNN